MVTACLQSAEASRRIMQIKRYTDIQGLLGMNFTYAYAAHTYIHTHTHTESTSMHERS